MLLGLHCGRWDCPKWLVSAFQPALWACGIPAPQPQTPNATVSSDHVFVNTLASFGPEKVFFKCVIYFLIMTIAKCAKKFRKITTGCLGVVSDRA